MILAHSGSFLDTKVILWNNMWLGLGGNGSVALDLFQSLGKLANVDILGDIIQLTSRAPALPACLFVFFLNNNLPFRRYSWILLVKTRSLLFNRDRGSTSVYSSEEALSYKASSTKSRYCHLDTFCHFRERDDGLFQFFQIRQPQQTKVAQYNKCSMNDKASLSKKKKIHKNVISWGRKRIFGVWPSSSDCVFIQCFKCRKWISVGNTRKVRKL